MANMFGMFLGQLAMMVNKQRPCCLFGDSLPSASLLEMPRPSRLCAVRLPHSYHHAICKLSSKWFVSLLHRAELVCACLDPPVVFLHFTAQFLSFEKSSRLWKLQVLHLIPTVSVSHCGHYFALLHRFFPPLHPKFLRREIYPPAKRRVFPEAPLGQLLRGYFLQVKCIHMAGKKYAFWQRWLPLDFGLGILA